MRQIPRLFVDQPLMTGDAIALADGPSHYLARVLRLAPGAAVHLFDDRTGQWASTIDHVGKRQVILRIGALDRVRETVPDLWLLTAPIRRERFEWIVEKATELGVSRIIPVRTERTNRDRLNGERLRAHMIEAAEQCERTALPRLDAAVPLHEAVAMVGVARTLIFADEAGGKPMSAIDCAPGAAILIGPEGGFAPAERAGLLARPGVEPLSLGPRILRADTAVVAAIAQWQARFGA